MTTTVVSQLWVCQNKPRKKLSSNQNEAIKTKIPRQEYEANGEVVSFEHRDARIKQRRSPSKKLSVSFKNDIYYFSFQLIMAESSSKLLLVTANVGSLFEEVSFHFGIDIVTFCMPFFCGKKKRQ